MTTPRLAEKECECGCGLPAPIAKQTRTSRGQVKGQPVRFIKGHNHYDGPPEHERFWERVDITEDGCWHWTGGVTGDAPYPRLYRGKSGYQLAHRWSYEFFVGEIPDGLTIDHLCRNTVCVNPDHLEPVSNVENVMRGEGACAVNARKTHCVRGHEFTEDNTRTTIGPNGNPGRSCRKCEDIRNRS